jgi:hypothetical protein
MGEDVRPPDFPLARSIVTQCCLARTQRFGGVFLPSSSGYKRKLSKEQAEAAFKSGCSEFLFWVYFDSEGGSDMLLRILYFSELRSFIVIAVRTWTPIYMI